MLAPSAPLPSLQVGGWDPITRVPMTLADVRPNIAMRNAVSLYLEEHPWAWHESYDCSQASPLLQDSWCTSCRSAHAAAARTLPQRLRCRSAHAAATLT